MKNDITKEKWGFLREHSSRANGKDPLISLQQTGLDVLFSLIPVSGGMIEHFEMAPV